MSQYKDGNRRGQQRSTAPVRMASQQEEPLSVTDFVLIGVLGFMFLAFLGVFFFLFLPALTHSSGPTISPSIVILVIIYALCIVAGWLWGRYQSQTAAHRENERLQQRIAQLKEQQDELERERSSLAAQLRLAQSTPPAPARLLQGSSSEPGAIGQQRVPIRNEKPPDLYSDHRDPDDPDDMQDHPHERIFPEKQEHDSLRFGWRVVGASRRGYGHAYEGKYREDDFHVQLYRGHDASYDIALIAIADGVSSKELSRRGARAAVLGATDVPNERLNALRSLAQRAADPQRFPEETAPILYEALRNARARVEEAATRSNTRVDLLQSTLLVFLTMPLDPSNLLVASTQIGDGALFMLKQDMQQDVWSWIQPPQIQQAGNEVQPFMRSEPRDWEKYFKFQVVKNARCVMGMTDGVADDIEPPRRTTGNANPDQFAPVQLFYQTYVFPCFKQKHPGDELVKALGYKKRGSHDDRTVVCVYR